MPLLTGKNKKAGLMLAEPENTQDVKAEVSAPADVPASTPVEASVEPVIEQKDENVNAEVIQQALPKLTERELKEKINLLRQRVEQNERELKSTFREISLHNTGGDELKTKRDSLNARTKELFQKAAELRKKRDEANARIAELKSQRDRLRGIGKEFSEKVGELKKTRDELNQTARGRLETLEKAYGEELNLFLTADLPLDYEINIFNRLNELSLRLGATKKANEIHTEISVEYSRAKEIYTDMDSLHAKIQTLAQESQKYHEELIALYKDIDALRKEADSYHSQLTEKYKGIAPLRKKISAIKAELPKLRDELGIYLEQMKEVQLTKDEQKNIGKREEAREKFQKNGRVSLDEFRILVENEDIKL
ncbi:MAG: phosphoserine phosphatase [Candidatus Methanoperedens sp.]|nr:phosphoserine phosphatase [Candidatus Methanoperedens sp.]